MGKVSFCSSIDPGHLGISFSFTFADFNSS